MKNRFTNRRKLNFFGSKKLIIFFISIILLLFCIIYINFSKVSSITYHYIQKYSNIYEYNLTDIEIAELNYINKNEIINFFKPYIGKSIFLTPLEEISLKIKDNKWVNNLKIKSNYKNTLFVKIFEENPLGIYDNNNVRILFSHNLVVLEILENKIKYEDLIVFYGENSLNNAKKLIVNLDKDFLKNIKSAVFIENRRWNIILKNEILLKLPEENIKDGLNIYKKIYAKLSNKELKEIEIIDLRIKNRAILKYDSKIND